MNLKENIVFLLESYEDSYKKCLVKLRDYDDVDGIDNLMNLIFFMKNNNYFTDFYKVIDYVLNLDDFELKYDYSHNSNNNFLKMACSQLRSPSLFYSKKKLINIRSLDALLSLVLFNFYFYSDLNKVSLEDIVKLVYNGNISLYFTFFVDEFNKMNILPRYDEEFFKSLSKMTFDSEKSDQLQDNFRIYISLVIAENTLPHRFSTTICITARYLMACNALKHGRDSISCEDVVVGYTLSLKLLCDDIREYVIKYYGEDVEKLNVSSNAGNVVNHTNDKQWGFKGVVSGIFAILAFLEVLLLIISVKTLIAPSASFTNNPILRFGSLIVSFIVAKKFFNYLNEGSDINLFEDGKSRVMLIFIIVFIVTIVLMVGIF